jgi:NAD+ synthase
MSINEEINNVVEWIRNYLGDKKAIVGLSGGVDSAVVAALCVRAVGRQNVIGVILPCYSLAKDKRLAIKLANKLEIEYKIINLKTTFNRFVKSASGEFSNLDKGNIKARLRMTALYSMAGLHSGFVIGTTNLSEAAIGFATKYGDHGVDIEPIGEFYKSEVYEMAKLLEVPKQIIERAPTAGLWYGQTDENEIGLTYDRIDEILKDPEFQPVFFKNDEPTDADWLKVYRMIKASEHKRHIPPCYFRD